MNLKLLLLLFLAIITNPIQAQEENSSGYLKLEFNADSALLVIDYDFLAGTTIASGDSVALTSGEHFIEVNRPLSQKKVRKIFISENETLSLNLEFEESNISKRSVNGNYASRDYFSSNIFIMTDEDSDIYYNDEYQGTGFAKLDAPYGSTQIQITNPNFSSKTIKVNAYPFLEVYEHYRKPKESFAKSLAIFPGASQFYKQQRLKGALLTASVSTFLFLSITSSLDYSQEKKLFDDYVKEYNETQNQDRAFLLGNQAENQRTVVKKAQNQKRLMLTALVLSYGFNIFDAVTNIPKGGYKKTKPLNFYLSSDLINNGTQTATLRYNF